MIPIHVGTILYGRVDQVPGLFYVATLFAHLNFLPFGPIASYVILDGTEHGTQFQGYFIPLSRKSILVAWVRAVLFALVGFISVMLVLVVGGILVVAAASAKEVKQDDVDFLIGVSIAFGIDGVLLLLLFVSYRLTRASPMRALELAKIAEISPEKIAAYFADRIPSLELDKMRNQAADVSPPSKET